MVIDACVWIAAFLPEDMHHHQAAALLRQLVQERRTVVLPTLALAEVCGAIARRTDSQEVAQAISNFMQAQPWIGWAPLDFALGKAAADLAVHCRLRGADAVYVALAAGRQPPLITLDGEMLERAPAQVWRMTPAEWLLSVAGKDAGQS